MPLDANWYDEMKASISRPEEEDKLLSLSATERELERGRK
jgi:hypothetical protein